MPKVKITTIDSIYDRWTWTVSQLQSLVLLGMRLYWGWQFFVAGKPKLMDPDKFVPFFEKLQIPMPKLNVLMAGSAECFGGLLLLAGLGSRIITIPLIFTMCVALWTADHDKVVNIWNEPDKFVSAAPFAFLLCSLIVLVFGPGKFSLDYLIALMRGRHRRPVVVEQT
jgi:putative oxidoreductase